MAGFALTAGAGGVEISGQVARVALRGSNGGVWELSAYAKGDASTVTVTPYYESYKTGKKPVVLKNESSVLSVATLTLPSTFSAVSGAYDAMAVPVGHPESAGYACLWIDTTGMAFASITGGTLTISYSENERTMRSEVA